MAEGDASSSGRPPAAESAAGARPAGRSPDLAATLTITAVIVAALIASWWLPWWVMKSRAPQYGLRVLVVDVSPRTVQGDVREVDLLGHYVGIPPMTTFASLERMLAPFGLAGAVACVLLSPWARPRWLRLAVLLPVLVMPIVMPIDLQFWMERAVTHRSPDAALELPQGSNIVPKLIGEYDVGQFEVTTEFGAGFYLDLVAALLSVGFIFMRPLPLPDAVRQRKLFAALLAAGLASCGGPPRAHGAEIAAGGERTLADAVAAARDGDTIVVAPGVHREHLVVDRSVRLLGRPGAVIDGAAEGTVLRISAPGVEVRGLTIRGSGDSYTTEDAGIRIEKAADVRVVDTRVEDTLFGIFVAQGDRCLIEGSTIVGKDLPEVRRGDGIRIWYSTGCRLTGNRVERSRDVIIWYSNGTSIEDNVVRTSRYGLHYMYSNDNVFRRNRFEDNQVGAAIMYSRGIELTENSFSFSSGPAAYGLLVKDADDVFIIGNRFIHNSTGLFFDDAPQAKDGRVDVRGNLIARGDVGIALQPLSRRIRFWENTLVGNRVQVEVLGGGSVEDNEWAVGGRGNYWSDAAIYDADGDGLSELPYRLESSYEALADRYPALAFFDGTPAAEAIDTAARLFPIFAPRPKITDPHPLARPALTAWTESRDASHGGAGLAFTGGALLSLAGAGFLGARRALA